VIVYSGGTFDLIHPGHVSLFRQCRALAGPEGRVVISVNTDEFVKNYKKRSPIMTFDDRCDVLLAMRDIDDVIENIGGADSKPAIESVNPDIIAIGEDWRDKDYHAQMGFTQDWLNRKGITLIYVPLLPDRSSTGLRNRARMNIFP
jgi:glycerol-3-phosphate cytidylyltransferase